MLIQKVIAGMFALVAGSAFADVGSPVSVSLADLKAKCADILANPQMVKPRVKVTCNDV